MKVFKIVLLYTAVILTACNDKPEASDVLAPEPPPFNAVNTGKTINSGNVSDIRVKLDPDKLSSIKILINGKEVLNEKAEKELISYQWNTRDYKLGVYDIEFIGTLVNGKTRKQRLEKVLLASRAPEQKKVRIIKEFPHDRKAYTQGLEFHENILLEGTGNRGESNLRKVNFSTGKVLQQVDLEGKYFGEGITLFNNKIYQITYTAKKGFVYSLDSLKTLSSFDYNTNSGEGWGLTHDDTHLIMTDGTQRIYFLDPETYVVEKTLDAYTHQGPISNLNELEYVDGKIYANIYTTNQAVKIDANSGMIETVYDLTELRSNLPDNNVDYLNGLAYNKTTDKWYATGKYWPTLFEIALN